jgi:hypothetical protein
MVGTNIVTPLLIVIYDIAKFLYPDNEFVANIKLDDSEFTGEI